MSEKAAHLNVGANCLKTLEKSKHKKAFLQDLPFSTSFGDKEICYFFTMFVISVISYMNCFAFKSCLKIQRAMMFCKS